LTEQRPEQSEFKAGFYFQAGPALSAELDQITSRGVFQPDLF